MITHKGKTYKVVAVTPAGRRRYMELLFHYIAKNRAIVDRYEIWSNTLDEEDIKYFEFLQDQFPEFVVVKTVTSKEKPSSHRIRYFFHHAKNEDTIYVRLDDDIIWLDDNFFETICKFRIDNPEYLMVFGNIINNSICDHLHQRFGAIKSDKFYSYFFKCNNGWKNGELAYTKHVNLIEKIKNGTLNDYKFNKWELMFRESVSINAICWFGDIMAYSLCEENVSRSEEDYWTIQRPKSLDMINCICGSALCSHFAFYTQRDHMDTTDALELYRSLI